MLDPEDKVWDQYWELSRQHEREMDIALRTGRTEDYDRAYATHLKVMAVLKHINSEAPEGELPIEEQVVQYIAGHQMCGTEELTDALGISIDMLRVCLEKLGDRVFLDSHGAKARFWVTCKGRGDGLTPEQLDELVSGYMYRVGSVFPDECAVHLGVSVKRVTVSLQRQKFPTMNVMAQNGGVLTQYRPHEEQGISQ